LNVREEETPGWGKHRPGAGMREMKTGQLYWFFKLKSTEIKVDDPYRFELKQPPAVDLRSRRFDSGVYPIQSM
jgi:hypothetical protein